MELHRLTIGSREFFLSSSEAMDELKERITSALHEGGGWVDILSAKHRSISVLITSSVHITAETIEAPDSEIDDGDEHERPPFDDY